jgi:hypothetical protein
MAIKLQDFCVTPRMDKMPLPDMSKMTDEERRKLLSDMTALVPTVWGGTAHGPGYR